MPYNRNVADVTSLRVVAAILPQDSSGFSHVSTLCELRETAIMSHDSWPRIEPQQQQQQLSWSTVIVVDWHWEWHTDESSLIYLTIHWLWCHGGTTFESLSFRQAWSMMGSGTEQIKTNMDVWSLCGTLLAASQWSVLTVFLPARIGCPANKVL